MFIVLRKTIIKKYLILSLAMIIFGQIMVRSNNAQAQVTEIPITITAEVLKLEGFTNEELKSMGFVNGLGKIIIYNAKQKQLWNARVEKARERVEVAKKTKKKPNPKDLYLLERDEQIKNPPKKPLTEKLFGQYGVQVRDYFKSDVKMSVGEGLTLGGVLLLLKTLAPLALAI